MRPKIPSRAPRHTLGLLHSVNCLSIDAFASSRGPLPRRGSLENRPCCAVTETKTLSLNDEKREDNILPIGWQDATGWQDVGTNSPNTYLRACQGLLSGCGVVKESVGNFAGNSSFVFHKLRPPEHVSEHSPRKENLR